MGFKAITVNTPEEQEAHILAEDDATLYSAIIGDDCVLPVGNQFSANITSNNNIRLSDGMVLVGGHVGRIVKGDYEDMSIENGVSGQNRNDLIVARFISGGTAGADDYRLVVVKGAPGKTATDPPTVQGDLYSGDVQRDFPLWRVRITGLSIAGIDKLFPDDEFTNRLFLKMHPVGCIYMSTSPTNPENIFGGKWVAWGAGRVPVGVSENEDEFKTVEKTGGAKSNNLAHSHTVNAHSHWMQHSHTVNNHVHRMTHSHTVAHHTHSTGNHALTIHEIPSHTHNIAMYWGENQGAPGGHVYGVTNPGGQYNTQDLVSYTGGGGAHNHGNTGSSSPETDIGTRSATDGSSPNTNNGNRDRTDDASTGTNSQLGTVSNLQPYITCYMWKRTA